MIFNPVSIYFFCIKNNFTSLFGNKKPAVLPSRSSRGLIALLL